MSLPRRLGPWVAAAIIAIAAVFGLMWRTQTVSSTHRADYVIIAGAAGLRWDDVNPVDTPTLWKLAEKDTIGELSVRSAQKPTCAVDGWLTLGAGNYARRDQTPATNVCPPMSIPVASPDGIGANVADQGQIVAYNRSLPYGAQPGALVGSVRCTVAVGTGAAIAAARPFGRVDRYEAVLPADAAKLLSTCTLSIVDLGTVDGLTPAARANQARDVDALLTRVLAARPDRSLVLVAGLSDTDTRARLHVAIADGPGYDGGWLTSTSTGREGYLQLVDLAPTALAALGRPQPAKLFAGAQAQRVGTRPIEPNRAVARLADGDHEAAVQHGIAGGFFWLLLLGECGLLLVSVPLLRRARRSTGPHGPPPIPPRLVRGVEALLVTAALTIAVVLFTEVVPWWRSSFPALVFVLFGAVPATLATLAVVLGPWWRGALGPIAAVGTIVTGTIGIDVLTGSHLELNGVAGYSALEGARYAGIGPVALGAFIVASMLLAACLAQRLPERRWRPAVVAAVGAVCVILVGSPYLGADAGGAVALTAGVCIASAIATGGWLTFARFFWATLAGLVVLIGFAVLDLRRPVAQRGSVGRFLTEIHDGTAGIAIHRIFVADVLATVTSPLSLFVGVAIVVNMLVLVKPWGGLMRLFGLYPAIRGALTGIAVASILAGLIDGVGLITAGAAASVALPLVTLAALRVLDHADDRTVNRPNVVEPAVVETVPVSDR